MYYCETSGRRICYRPPLSSRINDLAQPWAGAMITFLKVMLTPESSIPSDAAADQSLNRWLEAAKTLFWTFNTIAIGIILAKICS